MPTFRCEFDVSADLVLPPTLSELKFTDATGVEIVLRNGPADAEGHAVTLRAIVFGPSESIDTAEEELRSVLARTLDLLTFVTHSRFKIDQARRAVDWDAGAKLRNFRVYHTKDARQPPDPELVDEFLQSASALDRSNPPGFARAALNYFRLGLLESQPQDQFMRLWIALEIVAENVKEKEQVGIVCAKCGAEMSCGVCGTPAVRIPMAKQAIESVISWIAGDRAKAVSKRQFTARNALMHGRSKESLEAECGASLADLVNELGWLTWNAIISTIPCSPDKPLHFGHRGGDFVSKLLVMRMSGQFDHTGETPHPTEDKIPEVKIDLLTTFRKPGASSENRGS